MRRRSVLAALGVGLAPVGLGGTAAAGHRWREDPVSSISDLAVVDGRVVTVEDSVVRGYDPDGGLQWEWSWPDDDEWAPELEAIEPVDGGILVCGHEQLEDDGRIALALLDDEQTLAERWSIDVDSVLGLETLFIAHHPDGYAFVLTYEVTPGADWSELYGIDTDSGTSRSVVDYLNVTPTFVAAHDGAVLVSPGSAGSDGVPIERFDRRGNRTWRDNDGDAGTDAPVGVYTDVVVEGADRVVAVGVDELYESYNFREHASTVVAFDGSGQRLWSRRIEPDEDACCLQRLAPTPDGGYLVAGTAPDRYEVGLVRLTANGEVVERYTSDVLTSKEQLLAFRPFGDGYLLGGVNSPGPPAWRDVVSLATIRADGSEWTPDVTETPAATQSPTSTEAASIETPTATEVGGPTTTAPVADSSPTPTDASTATSGDGSGFGLFAGVLGGLAGGYLSRRRSEE